MNSIPRWLGKLKKAFGAPAGTQGDANSGNRYARDWNEYSRSWDAQFGRDYSHLGDEWNDDATQQRERDQFYFRTYAERFLKKDMTALEIGPGGGKWTVRIAPLVKKMIVMDVSEEMLRRTEEHCRSEEISNVECLLGNGRDFQPVADDSVDFFFSYDVFVHIALEDTWPYALEMARVLKPGGVGVCHHAINSVPEAWNRIEQNNDWYRFGKHTLGQYYYYSPESLRRMYERTGMMVVEQHQEAWHCTCIFKKPGTDIVPRLEALLRQLISQQPNDERGRAEILSQIRSLHDMLRQTLEPVFLDALNEHDFNRRSALVAQIRSIWRGM
jgi:ubiquinone/menaquinone biosynthesis C-methylase UbiE